MYFMFKPVSFFGRLFKSYLLFPSHPSKIRMERFAGRFFFPSGIKIKNGDGVGLKLDPNDWITRIMIEEGGYETASIELAKKIVNTGGVFIDVGANFGLYSCILGFKNDRLKIYSVEPNYQVLQRLTGNIKLNRLTKQVQIINAAVSEKFQLLFLQVAKNNNLGTAATSLSARSGICVLSCPLEYILTHNNLGQIDLLKIDIEGNEFGVLESFPFGEYSIRNIIVEFNRLSNIPFDKLINFFSGKGFKSFTISGDALVNDRQPIPEDNIWFVNQE